MKLLDLFSGIGGFSLGFERAGFETVGFCEIDEFCRKVLKSHWPDVPVFEDVARLSAEHVGQIDVITGGFPCQDFSVAGKQKGINGTRSGLWWEMRRIISEVRPKFAIMENVPNFLSGYGGNWFREFLGSLAEIGYDAEWTCISAAAVSKPHARERLWVIAYPAGFGLNDYLFEKIKLSEIVPKPQQNKKNDIFVAPNGLQYPAIPEYLRMDDGLPAELDEIKSRVKAMGNSIVPEIAFLIAQQLRDETRLKKQTKDGLCYL
jgi:DNA (cytosine-5)-methyltransferase 1